jgi:hypothetical protein
MQVHLIHNNLTVNRNGHKYNGSSSLTVYYFELQKVYLCYFCYVDGTQRLESNTFKYKLMLQVQIFIVTATGGTVTTCGDYKIHTFTSPGTFTVT